MERIKSTMKYSNHGCTRKSANPQFRAEVPDQNNIPMEGCLDILKKRTVLWTRNLGVMTPMEKHERYLRVK